MTKDANDVLLDRLKARECPDATSPSRAPALVFARAKGSLVYDAAGREYIDLCAGFGALSLGHNPPEHVGLFAAHADASSASEPQPVVHGMGDVYASTAKVASSGRSHGKTRRTSSSKPPSSSDR